jgi:PucR C-terminal helix-turn-helix domain/GGDEF-like domain
MLARVFGITGANGAGDPEYAEGLRASVSTAVNFGLSTIELERAQPVPTGLLAQARLAARNGVGLDTVLRRYFAGHMLLSDFAIDEAEEAGLLQGPALKHLVRNQLSVFDRLITAIAEEHARERAQRVDSTEERRAETVQRLLAGELPDTAGLAYDFDCHHVGLVATGRGATEVIAWLATALDRRPLMVSRGEDRASVWAWLGGRRPVDDEEIQRRFSPVRPGRVSVAVGQSGHGLGGWRLTHHQAAAALPVALRRGQPVVYYRDVALLASMLKDPVLVASLHEMYLTPLERGRDRGETARRTLRAYFAANRNVSSAAQALGVARRTVTYRLRMIEQKLARPLDAVAAEVEAALLVDELEQLPDEAATP